MKHYILTSLFGFGIFAISAQTKLPNPGKIDISDLQVTDCSFEKGAIAYKIIDWGNVYYERGTEGISLFKQVYEKRVRIKILKDKGLSYANVTIPYYSYNNDQKVTKTEAYTFNLDESGKVKVTEVGKSSIYTKKINKRYSELIITFPEAKVGSVIEYKYRMEREMFWLINDWYFQDRIPTQHSEYQLKVPLVFQFSVHPVVAQAPEIKQETFDDMIATGDGLITVNTIKKNYIMKNVPGINDEPYMGTIKDYQQRLEFQLSKIDFGNGNAKDYSSTWADVVTNLNKDEDFGLQLAKETEDFTEVLNTVKSIQSEEAKLKYLFNFVRDELKWNEEDEIYAFTGLTKTWGKKEGSSGDINLLLTYLLRKAGLKANPILLSTRDHGLVNDLYPFIAQFNTVMCHVPIGNKFFILDATEKFANYKIIPEKVTNTSGLIVTDERGKWIDLIDNHKYKVMAALHGEMNMNGNMKINAIINHSDYAKTNRSTLWRKDAEAFKKEYFTAPSSNTTIEELTVKNATVDSLPLEQIVNLNQQLNSSGNYIYFNYNLFTGLDQNPFIEDTRTTDVDFGYTQDYTIFGNFAIPEGYTFEYLPKNITLLFPDNSIEFNRTMQVEDNLLNIRVTLEYKRNFYTAAEYPDFKEFYKKLFAALNEQIVLKKKTTP